MIMKTDKIISVYFFLSIILFSFFMSESSYLAQNVIVPYVKASPLYIHLGITIIVLILILIIKRGYRINIDIIFVFLVARIFISILPVVYIEGALETIGRVTVPIISALAYFIGRQYKGKIDSIVKINMIFVGILSLQTMYTVKNMVVPNIIYYGQFIKIPIGSTNLIAAFIVPCMFLIITFSDMKRKIRYPIAIISFIAIIESTSTGAIIISAVMLILYIIFFNDKISLSMKVFFVLLVGVATMIYILFILDYNYTLDYLTHNRYGLFLSDLKLWTEHILLGNGMVYEGRSSGTHNILMDLLVQSGLIGFLAYLVPLIKVFTSLIKNTDKRFLCLKLYLIATFLHSLIETSYFNYINDMLFWFMSGIALSLIQIENKKERAASTKSKSIDYPIPNHKMIQY